ncbi:MAG: glycosyltransferase family 4 protein, partial [Bacteroidota bacterium]|nr:glycosyltransferase family 4 protein [Bacteroidota bacterium]
INTMIHAGESRQDKWRHYAKAGVTLGQTLEQYPNATIVWTSISPEAAGHFRDVKTIFPRLKGKRVVAAAHWGKFAQVFSHPLTRWSARRLLPGLDRIVFTAPVLSEACATWLPEGRRAVIPNTLDPEVIPDATTVSNRIDEGVRSRPRVLFLSNMFVEKGWPDVLEAAALMHAEGFEAEWFFAGAWPSDDVQRQFLDQVTRLELTESVVHLGAMETRAQVAEQYLAADIFVLPSWLREAQPLTIMEAMAAGTPCVVADDGGMPDLIGWNEDRDKAAGEVVPARDPSALAAALMRVTEPNRWERAAREARNRFDRLYAPAAVEQKWVDLLDSLEAGA